MKFHIENDAKKLKLTLTVGDFFFVRFPIVLQGFWSVVDNFFLHGGGDFQQLKGGGYPYKLGGGGGYLWISPDW